ncbi:MAG: hypothetical protein FJ096_18215, partial [Deltaproteobacteria bacterium]|nr:hypothetical protein [Deltaproteobacteria bacterium]
MMNPTVSQLTYHVQAALERLLRLAGGRSAWGSRGQFMDAMVEAMVGVEALVGAINAFYEVPGPTFAMCARARVNL